MFINNIWPIIGTKEQSENADQSGNLLKSTFGYNSINNYLILTFLSTLFIVIHFYILHMTLTLCCYQVVASNALF